MSINLTAAMLDFAGTQDGVIAVDQLADIGVTRRWLGNLVRSAVLTRAAAGVYVVTGAPPTFHQHLRVGLLSLGEASWVSHEAAAFLHRFEVSNAPRRPSSPCCARRRALAAVTGSTRRSRCRASIRSRSRGSGAHRRLVLDLAHARVSVRRLEQAVDSSVRLGLSSPTALAKRLEQFRGRGRDGSPQLERLLVDSGGHTKLERDFLALVRRAGLPRPATQVVHAFQGRTIARVDFLFDPFGVVVEVSGQLGHSTPTDRDRDAQRRDELQDLGRKVYEYTWNQVGHRPDYVEQTLTRRLQQAGWRR